MGRAWQHNTKLASISQGSSAILCAMTAGAFGYSRAASRANSGAGRRRVAGAPPVPPQRAPRDRSATSEVAAPPVHSHRDGCQDFLGRRGRVDLSGEYFQRPRSAVAKRSKRIGALPFNALSALRTSSHHVAGAANQVFIRAGNVRELSAPARRPSWRRCAHSKVQCAGARGSSQRACSARRSM